ncbi:MAG TPA: 2OG-Fe(II) oxygenase [Saprospiraceae bacterium]|nr:2OG-Fe(II) oxygenase [Saprospiraceae bacterium]HMP22492.1 2OG-Fe(II) oxygenase [Saprospiraceae bacterium]
MSARKIFAESLFETVADNLAELGYAVLEDVFASDDLAMLRQELYEHYEQGDLQPAAIGTGALRQQNTAIRGDHIRWMERDNTNPTCHFFFDLIEALTEYLNQTCFLGIRSYELHFAMYPPGAFYKRHLDVFQQSKARKISIVCYLNEAWQEHEGGQLRLFLPSEAGEEKTLDLLPFGGRLVCFRSDLLEHEVLPATRERLSITGWLRTDNAILL